MSKDLAVPCVLTLVATFIFCGAELRGQTVLQRGRIGNNVEELAHANTEGLSDSVIVLDGYGEVIDTIPDHLIYVFDLVGDSRAEAVILTGIEPGMQMQIVTNDRLNPNPATNRTIKRRQTTLEMVNCTRY